MIFRCHANDDRDAPVDAGAWRGLFSLIYLLKKSGLELSGDRLDFIGKINTASIPTRYPDDLQRSLKEYPKSVAKDYLHQTMELVQWLEQHPNLSES